MIMVVATVIVFSCSKNDDPTPVQKTALDSVKLAMSGSWKFSNMTVTQISTGKSATTSTCGKTELSTAGFGNSNYVPVTPEFNYTYNSDDLASESNVCVNATASVKITASLNSDKSVNLTISDPINNNTVLSVYQVKSKNITANTIYVNIISDGSVTAASTGYSVLYKFTRQ